MKYLCFLCFTCVAYFGVISVMFLGQEVHAQQLQMNAIQGHLFSYTEDQLSTGNAENSCAYCFINFLSTAPFLLEGDSELVADTALLVQNDIPEENSNQNDEGTTDEEVQVPLVDEAGTSEDDVEGEESGSGRIEPGSPLEIAEPIEADAELQSYDFEPNLDTPLNRYKAKTDESIYWRTEAIFFISIPFSYLWSSLLKLFTRYFSTVGAFFDGARAPDLDAVNFVYSHNYYPREGGDPFYIFTWVNTVVWPLMVAFNDVIERSYVPEKWDAVKAKMRSQRFYDDIIYTTH